MASAGAALQMLSEYHGNCDYEFLEVKIVYNNLHMNCLLGCCKMTFTIHPLFTSLVGMIFRPLLTTFCSCFVIILLEKITFFVFSTCCSTRNFMNFFLKKCFLASTATLCSLFFLIVYQTLFMGLDVL